MLLSKLKYKAIVIGVSAGGLSALRVILAQLPVNYKIPVIIVQHRHPESDNIFEHMLEEICSISVKQIEDKENIDVSTVYVAPPNYHVLVEEDLSFSLSIEDKVNYARPSIDVLFESAADAICPDLIGVILTGANNDGSKGLKKIKEMGGIAIVQEPETAEVAAMPRAAINLTPVDNILPLEKIGRFLVDLTN